jgi:hypothetical protein
VLFGVVAVLAGLAGCTDDENGAGRDDDAPVRDDEGQVVDETELTAYRIEVGDCFNGSIPFAVQTITAIPCDEPHDQEAYALYDLAEEGADDGEGEEGEDGGEEGEDGGEEGEDSAGEEAPWPGDTRVHQLAERGCLVRFGEYVGAPYEVSTLEIGLLMPTEQTWTEIDDREVVCTVHRADGTRLEQSAEGSGL